MREAWFAPSNILKIWGTLQNLHDKRERHNRLLHAILLRYVGITLTKIVHNLLRRLGTVTAMRALFGCLGGQPQDGKSVNQSAVVVKSGSKALACNVAALLPASDILQDDGAEGLQPLYKHSTTRPPTCRPSPHWLEQPTPYQLAAHEPASWPTDALSKVCARKDPGCCWISRPAHSHLAAVSLAVSLANRFVLRSTHETCAAGLQPRGSLPTYLCTQALEVQSRIAHVMRPSLGTFDQVAAALAVLAAELDLPLVRCVHLHMCAHCWGADALAWSIHVAGRALGGGGGGGGKVGCTRKYIAHYNRWN